MKIKILVALCFGILSLSVVSDFFDLEARLIGGAVIVIGNPVSDPQGEGSPN